MNLLKSISTSEIDRVIKPAVSNQILEESRIIVEHVRWNGKSAVRAYAEQFEERTPDQPLTLGRDAMRIAYDAMDANDRDALNRAAERIRRFAKAQRDSIQPLTLDVPGGQTGHTIEPVHAAGCYAPAGRYPLPSTVLMTGITARVAGCQRVVIASPGANSVTLAAAHIAGADEFLCVGGAHAIAALSFGFEGFERCDVIVGPGNAWVTAAKQLVSGQVGIDMLAGPSELLILADESAPLELLAADLLAQAEHDIHAIPMLVTTCPQHAETIQIELQSQLETLITADTARVALGNGFVIVCENLDQAIGITNLLAPEHLEIITKNPDQIAARVRNAGAIFIGASSAEVLGDYGLGPNHTLPTGGTSRFQAGLSVMHFLRLRTWIRIDDPDACLPILEDTRRIARMEHLLAHERSATLRTTRK